MKRPVFLFPQVLFSTEEGVGLTLLSPNHERLHLNEIGHVLKMGRSVCGVLPVDFLLWKLLLLICSVCCLIQEKTLQVAVLRREHREKACVPVAYLTWTHVFLIVTLNKMTYLVYFN